MLTCLGFIKQCVILFLCVCVCVCDCIHLCLSYFYASSSFVRRSNKCFRFETLGATNWSSVHRTSSSLRERHLRGGRSSRWPQFNKVRIAGPRWPWQKTRDHRGLPAWLFRRVHARCYGSLATGIARGLHTGSTWSVASSFHLYHPTD